MSAVTDLIGNATSSSYTAPTQYNTWQPSGTNQQDTNFNTAVNQNLNSGNAAVPAWQQYLSSLTNNPYQAGAQTASNAAGTNYTNVGNQAVANGNNLSGASTALLNTAMNPQSALYNQQQQNNTDQTNASLAARGLTTSGAGADLAQQSNMNFNTNWMNNLQGLQSQAIGTAGTGYTTAGNLGTSGANSLNMGGAVPASTYNAGVNQLGSGLGTYTSGANSTNQTALADIMSYLGLGAQQSDNQGVFNDQQWENMNSYTGTQNQQNAALWGNIGQIGQNAGMSSAPMLFA